MAITGPGRKWTIVVYQNVNFGTWVGSRPLVPIPGSGWLRHNTRDEPYQRAAKLNAGMKSDDDSCIVAIVHFGDERPKSVTQWRLT